MGKGVKKMVRMRGLEPRILLFLNFLYSSNHLFYGIPIFLFNSF